MKNKIKNLIQDCTDNKISLEKMLLQGLEISKEKEDKKIVGWISYELFGYLKMDNFPEYRNVKGSLVAAVDLNHLINPIKFEDPSSSLVRDLTEWPFREPINMIEKLLNASQFGNNQYIKLPDELQGCLHEITDVPPHMTIYFEYTTIQLFKITASVKTALLQWLSELSVDSQLESMEDDKREDKGSITYVVNNFHGSVVNSQVQQLTQHSIQRQEYSDSDYLIVKSVIEELLMKLDQFQIVDDKFKEIKADLQTMIVQLGTTKPKFSILKECWKSVRNILEGVAGSVITPTLLEKMQRVSELLK